jgi:hypothetical protein
VRGSNVFKIHRGVLNKEHQRIPVGHHFQNWIIYDNLFKTHHGLTSLEAISALAYSAGVAFNEVEAPIVRCWQFPMLLRTLDSNDPERLADDPRVKAKAVDVATVAVRTMAMGSFMIGGLWVGCEE